MKFFLTLSIFFVFGSSQTIPSGFGYVDLEIEGVVLETRYASKENFTGRIVSGYDSQRQVLTNEAIAALKLVQKDLKVMGLGIKVFDSYRPQRAVDSFVKWCADETDTLAKNKYYPNIAKKDIIPQGYIWVKSGHSRGSTVDLTIINLRTKEELDMGTGWDFFGKESWGSYDSVTQAQKENRSLLAEIMKKHGFKPIAEEWWHFTLIDEPYPDTYFDFIVE